MADSAPPEELEFTDGDRACLASYAGVVEAVARVFGPSCEVVLHSLEDVSRSVVKIENSHVTGRSVGSPMTDFGLQILQIAEDGGQDVIGPYFTRSGDHVLRSVTLILRNPAGRRIGYLCANMDLSAPLLDVMRALAPPPSAAGIGSPPPASGSAPEAATEPVEHFASSVKDLVRQALMAVPLPNGGDRNRRAVEELSLKGIFRMKGAVEIAAEELGISRHTIYYYLRAMRGKPEDGEGQEGRG